MNREDFFKNSPKPFIPKKLPLSDEEKNKIIDIDIYKLLNNVNYYFGLYIGLLCSVNNPDLLVSPLLSKETILSSQLEGTHATLEDILNYNIGMEIEGKKDEVKEVANYSRALNFAQKNMGKIDENNSKLPLSSRLIKQMHKILLNNVRGQSKSPGEYKQMQNYIGTSNSITFTPLPPELTEEYMTNLENYIHTEEIDIFIQCAIMHAQFEMIHPFQDGNGRIGRLLIPLLLYYKNKIPAPALYMSSFFNANKEEYIKLLNQISSNNDWNSWIKFFLNGVIYSSKESALRATRLNQLYIEFKNIINKGLKSSHGIELLDLIFENPIINASLVTKSLNINRQTANSLLNKLKALNILESFSNNSRRIIFYCSKLIKELD